MSREPQYVTYLVEGIGQFPLDMLRYDGSWPTSQEDVAKIHENLSGERPRRRELISLTTVSRLGSPETSRWESFMWRVVEVRS